MPLGDLEAINQKLDARGGFNCCSNGKKGCSNIETNGKSAVDLCTDDDVVRCVDCARLANYVEGLKGKCTKNGKVGARQEIVESFYSRGLFVEV